MSDDLEKERLDLEKERLEIQKLKLQQEQNYINQNNQSKSSAMSSIESIKKLSIISLVLLVIGLILFIISFISYSLLLVMILLSAFTLMASGIIELIAAIKILSTNFGNQEINESRTLWGLLSILLLGSIASLIFASKSKKIIDQDQ